MKKLSSNIIYNDISIEPLLIPYAGMGKDELLVFSKRPFWARLRSVFLICFFSIWIYLLSNAIFSIISAKPSFDKQWWKNSIIYEIYPRSFQDSNNDGIGDLPGIIQRLDYFNYLGIDAIWITPIFKSPMKDFGYDISDYLDVDPLFGSLTDMKELISIAHKKDLKIILDFVPNHTSNEHKWFNLSCQSVEPYRDYYVWKDGITLENDKMGPPNNWLSQFGGSAWTWNSQRSQYYYHAFLKEQPDLNYENPKVLEEMKDVLRFWLSMGVDGFRIDAVNNLHEDQEFLDEPINDEGSISASQDEYNYLDHIYVSAQPKTYETIGEFVKVIREYETDPKQIKVAMIEDYDPPEKLMAYYDISKSDYPFNFDFVVLNDLKSLGGGIGCQKIITNWMKRMKPSSDSSSTSSSSSLSSSDASNKSEDEKMIDYTKRWPNWVTGNHDRPRFASRFGENMTDAIHTLILLLPGTPTVYYGDELGMVNIDVPPFIQTQDSFALNMGPERYKLFTRDPQRSPMQWDGTEMAGFTEFNTSWLPINPDHVFKNFETEKKDRFSHVNIFRALTRLRKEPAFRDNIDLVYGPVTKNIISFIRSSVQDDNQSSPNSKGYFIIINVGREAEQYPLHLHPKHVIPSDKSLRVILTNFYSGDNNFLKIGSPFTFPCNKISSATYKMSSHQLQTSDGNLLDQEKSDTAEGMGEIRKKKGTSKEDDNTTLNNDLNINDPDPNDTPRTIMEEVDGNDSFLKPNPGDALVLSWGLPLVNII